VRLALNRRELTPWEAFVAFDADNNSRLSPSELYGALRWLQVPELTAEVGAYAGLIRIRRPHTHTHAAYALPFHLIRAASMITCMRSKSRMHARLQTSCTHARILSGVFACNKCPFYSSFT
jgi:hypothetical protein